MPQALTSPRLLSGAGRVKSIFAADAVLAQDQILENLKSQDDGPSIVTITWDKVPELRRELDGLVDAMAQAALSVWPQWYCSATERFQTLDDPTPDVRGVLQRAQMRGLEPSEAWLQRAWKRCANGRLPTSRKMTNAEQLRQLSRAVDPHHLVIIVTTLRPLVRKGRLQALAKALEWMAKETNSPVVFIGPAEWSNRPELDAVTYDSIIWSDLPSAPSSQFEVEPDRLARSDVLENLPRIAETPQSGSPEKGGSSVVVEPVLGKPHPRSPVEVHLGKHLSADPELSSLFRWNHLMPALGIGKKVDLFWQAGGLVIEIDGPDHLNGPKYNDDRERDYRLLLEGYTSLRITNDAVNTDVGMVIEKIRKVVRLFKTREVRKIDGIETQSGGSALAHAHG